MCRAATQRHGASVRGEHPLLSLRPRREYEEKTADRYTPVSQIIDCAKVLAATVGKVCA